MKGFLNMMGMTVFGGIGWWIGAFAGIFTAFIISTIGSGIGLYAAQRVTKHLLG